MENYDLRQCFVPDLSGLHIRIYQFRELLRQHLPTLSGHLDDLQVEPAYVSQWFLSFYAVTCPLPMLFRIYDVIFAEGASETIMRVALSLMRKNQVRILGCTELEDVMQLLLSRGVWDCYNHNADDFVQDFVALADVVTKDRMVALEQGYKEAKITSTANHRGGQAAQTADVTTAASRFLGRLWAGSSSASKFTPFATAAHASGSASASASASSSTLNPGHGAVSRPLSMLRRTTSKQSLASMEAVSSTTSSAASVLSSVSSEATTVSRDSAADDLPREASPPLKKTPTAFSGSANTSKDGSKYLHSQIEDLLMVLSELQQNHALLASQLQREKEDREEDRRAVRSLLDGLRKKAGGDDDSDATTPSLAHAPPTAPASADAAKPTAEQLSDLLDVVEERFNSSPTIPQSTAPETKLQLRDEVARTRENLSQERSKTKEFTRRIQEMEGEMASLRDQLRESHAHVRNVHQEKQRLERQIHGMRIRASDTPPGADRTEWFPKATAAAAAAGPAPPAVGLRELKLGRSRSTPSQAASIFSNKRASTMPIPKRDSSGSMATLATTTSQQRTAEPLNENDAILLDLVQAKTAEAVARQELEELKQKMEQLRKAVGLAPGEVLTAGMGMGMGGMQGGGNGGAGVGGAMGTMFGRLTGSGANTPVVAVEAPARGGAASPAPTMGSTGSGGGGFWGWRR
jgi:hypothetical protein